MDWDSIVMLGFIGLLTVVVLCITSYNIHKTSAEKYYIDAGYEQVLSVGSSEKLWQKVIYNTEMDLSDESCEGVE